MQGAQLSARALLDPAAIRRSVAWTNTCAEKNMVTKPASERPGARSQQLHGSPICGRTSACLTWFTRCGRGLGSGVQHQLVILLRGAAGRSLPGCSSVLFWTGGGALVAPDRLGSYAMSKVAHGACVLFMVQVERNQKLYAGQQITCRTHGLTIWSM